MQTPAINGWRFFLQSHPNSFATWRSLQWLTSIKKRGFMYNGDNDAPTIPRRRFLSTPKHQGIADTQPLAKTIFPIHQLESDALMPDVMKLNDAEMSRTAQGQFYTR